MLPIRHTAPIAKGVIMARQYKGRTYIKQLAHLKENYKGKNDSGGRKCVMGCSSEYRSQEGHARQWGMLREGTPNFVLETV